ARVVAADLGLLAPDRGHGGVITAGAGGPRGSSRRRSGGRRGRARGGGCRRAAATERRGRGGPRGGTGRVRRRAVLRSVHGPNPPEVADRLFGDPGRHGLEQVEAFAVVFDERVALPVAAQADAFLEVIEAVEVVLPLRV